MAATHRMDFSGLPRRTLEKNEALFTEGDPGSEMYVLLTGELGVFRAGEKLASITTPTSVVGEMSALTGAPRVATVQALKHSTVIVIDEPEAAFREHPRLAMKVARELASRLQGMNARLAEVKNRFSAPPAAAKPAAADLTDPDVTISTLSGDEVTMAPVASAGPEPKSETGKKKAGESSAKAAGGDRLKRASTDGTIFGDVDFGREVLDALDAVFGDSLPT